MTNQRRHFALLLLALCIIFMTACSKQAQDPVQNESLPSMQPNTAEAEAIAVSVAPGKYSTNYFSSSRLSIVSSAAADEATAYLWGCNFQNDVKTDWILQYSTDKSFEEYPLSLSEGGYITALDAAQGEVYYVERVDLEDGSAEWFLHDLQGAEKLTWPEQTSSLGSLVIGAGLAYIADGSTVYTCSLPDGNMLHTASAGAEITQALRVKDGSAVFYCENTGTFYRIENEGQTLTEAGKLPLLFQNCKPVSGMNSEYDCLIIGETALFGWNIGAAETTQILSFDTYGLVSSHFSAFVCLKDSTFLGATWKSGELEDRLFWLDPTDAAQTDDDEKILRIAGNSRAMVISAAISDFKALCPEYTVEYIDYKERYGDQALQQLQLDLIQENAPDLLFVNGLPLEAYISRGLLENLYEWIDADDSVTRDDFTGNLLAQMESHDHNLYQLPQSYSIVTTACMQARGGAEAGWTFATVNEEMEENEGLLSVFYGEPQESLAKTLPLYMIHALVDYENAQSHFDSDEAAAFLTFLNNIKPHDQIPYTTETELDALRSGEILFAQLMILSPEMFTETDESFDGALVYPGYPSAAGGSFYLNLPMAIPVAAKEKDGAWKFMKMLFSSEYYATRGGWIPLQKGFDASMQEAAKQGASQQSLDRLARIQENIGSLAYYDEMISDIILDETSYLFAGERTVAETAEQIHQRVQLYLTEQYG